MLNMERGGQGLSASLHYSVYGEGRNKTNVQLSSPRQRTGYLLWTETSKGKKYVDYPLIFNASNHIKR